MSFLKVRVGIRVLATSLALVLVVGVLYVAQATGSVATPTKSFKSGTATSRSVSDDDDDNGKKERKKCKRRYKKHGRPKQCKKHDRNNDHRDNDDDD